MEYARITKKGQVTIPLKFRDLLGIRSGEKVIFDVEEEKIVLKKAQVDPVSDIVGLGKGIFGTSVTYQRKIRSEWEDDENIP
jgi:AbrB family looped-hinge helix DNA binding protein